MAHTNVENLIAALKTARLFGQSAAVQYFDMKTVQPAGGAVGAAERYGFLSEQGHAAFVKDEVRSAIEQCESTMDELAPLEQLAIKRLRACYDRAAALPAEFIGRRDEAHAVANEIWKAARAQGDFPLFAPHLTRTFDLAKEEAVLLGAESGNPDSMYDALLRKYEPGLTVADIRPVLTDLGEWLASFMQRIQASGVERSDKILHGCFPEGKQRRLVEYLVSHLGYDFQRGVLLKTTHPFAGSICKGDHRITSRFYEDFLSACLFGTVHEGGHAMFEQGGPDLLWQIDNGSFFYSLGLHESQSRMWENIVCRSLEFWEYFYPFLQMEFPVFRTIPVEEFYQAINIAKPSAIRVEADELTYHGHILARFEVELAFLSGQITANDVPLAFADLTEKYVGYRPKTLAEGCLQDTHWSMGLVGYFPTYTLGTLASAQEFAAFANQNPCYEERFQQGDFSSLLTWLRTNIHATGHFDSLNNILMQATGEPLTAAPWKEYIEEKYGSLYSLTA